LEESGVELIFNTRIEKELENGDLLTTDGRTLDSELNLWCNYHKNNIKPLLPVFESSIERDRAEVIVNKRMQMQNTKNIFVIGDVINLRIIKTCGGAYHQGPHVSQSLYNIIVNQVEEYDPIDLSTWPHGMTIVVGTDRIIT
jgi:NADH dehydrogenase FAD-containing subunit